MANSRLEKLGTVFSRITSLIRTGTMKRADKPIWYDVYQVFPPKTTPSYSEPRPAPEIKPIFYPEDIIRAKFHKKMFKEIPAEDLTKNTTSDITIRAISLTYEALKENELLTEDQAIDKAIAILKKERVFLAKISPRQLKTKARITEKAKQVEKDVMRSEESNLKNENDDVVKNIADKNVSVSKILEDK